jgi:hypothetical protein
MKFLRYNEISIYVDFTVEVQGREVTVKWTTEDAILADNFEKVFADLTNDDDAYEEASNDFYENMYDFTLDRGDDNA